MWHLNRALTGFRDAVDARWPNRDHRSDGTIGDEAHKRRTSDHNQDPDGSVDAWDMDHDGVDPWLCIATFELHPSSGYWIYQDMIAHRSTGWRRQSYSYAGPARNLHLGHVHFNTRPSHEDSLIAWVLGAAPAPATAFSPGDRILRMVDPRMVGSDVQFVQKWIGARRAGAPDGVYGSQTEAGVRWYQAMRGITADGVVGDQTWAEMGVR